MTIQDLLNRLEDINKNIRENHPNLTHSTIYENLGILKGDGSAITAEEFMERYTGSYRTNKLNFMLKLTNVNSREEIYKHYVDSLIQTARNNGNEVLAEKLDNMSFEEFENKYYSGEFDSIIEEYTTTQVERAFTQRRDKLDKEAIDVSQVGDDTLPY